MLDVDSQKRPDRADGAIVDWQSRRQHIVENVTELYIERPWVNVSIEAIADRADLSFWQVYYSFDGQEDVYRAVVGRLFANIEAQLDAAPRASDTVRGTIADLVDWIETLFLSTDYRRLIFLKLRDGPSEPWLAMNFQRKIRDRVHAALEAQISAAGRNHGLSILCDTDSIKLSVARLEAATALINLVDEIGAQSLRTDRDKATAITDIWHSARSNESLAYAD